MNRFAKSLVFYILLIIVLFAGFGNLLEAVPTRTITYSDFFKKIGNQEIRSVTILENRILAESSQGKNRFIVFVPKDDKMIETLREANVEIRVEPPSSYNWFAGMFIQWLLPLLIIIGFWFWMLNRADANGSKAMSFGKSKARLVSDNQVKENFKSVAGCDEAKEELAEVVDFLKDPEKYQRLGGRIPKGVLLIGPPGTGKTLLSKAIAGEAGVPFFSISGSDFVEMFVGVGASRVRDLFQQGKKAAPCIIFIDELDAVGRQRGTGLGGGHDEREQTLNQLLVEMDGFEGSEGIILLSATNRPDVLDPALLRPGRFDRQVIVDQPDLKGRVEILEIHMTKLPLDEDVDVSVLARGTVGLVGADLANIVNEAALFAARNGQDTVNASNFEMARDKVIMGVERKSRVISDDEKKVTAYHEAGHALVSRKLPDSDPVHKVSIIPRGRALGVTHQLPEADRYHYSEQYFTNRLKVLFGGRIAEELIFDKKFTGAEHDMSVATSIAKRMVCSWGMSKLGAISYGRNDEHVFLGREISRSNDYSEETARRIDGEIHRILDEAYAESKRILTDNINKLHEITEELLKKETLNTEDLDKILLGAE